jgi:tRNA/rRNA methyltransferase
MTGKSVDTSQNTQPPAVTTEKGPMSKEARAALPPREPGPAICLVNPQMGENIGAAARAMANFGLEELILVAPRDGWPNKKAYALSSGAHWPLDNARLVATADEAVAGKTLVLATTGTPRDLVKPLIGPREAVALLREAMAAGEQPVVLFGTERTGLDNELIIAADVLVTYPVDGRFPSLNLAQSVAVFCYEWATRREAEGPPPGWVVADHAPAPRAAFESLFGHLVEELDRSRFFWPDDRRDTMVSTLRTALTRARMSMAETSLLRGALKSLIGGPRRRALESDEARVRADLEAWLAAHAPGAALVEVLVREGRYLAVAEVEGALHVLSGPLTADARLAAAPVLRAGASGSGAQP